MKQIVRNVFGILRNVTVLFVALTVFAPQPAQSQVVPGPGYSVEVFAANVQPQFQQGPISLSFDAMGNLFVAPGDYLRALKFPAGSNVPQPFGRAVNDADGVVVDSANNVIVAGTPYVYKFTPVGSQIWRAYCPIGNVQLVKVDENDVAYVGSLGRQIAKISANGSSVQVMGDFYRPSELVIGPDGLLYISVRGDLTVVQADPDTAQVLDTIISGVDATQPTFDEEGNLYIGDNLSKTIMKISMLDGSIELVASGFAVPRGLAFDNEGNLFVSDSTDKIIYKIVAIPGVADLIDDLIDYIDDTLPDEPPGLKNSLIAKLQNGNDGALDLYEAGDLEGAIEKLNDFINQVDSKGMRKRIGDEVADELIELAQEILNLIQSEL